MDFKRLRTFVAVAEEMGFARAGVRLGLAQPAVSKQIKDLETELGGRLIERRPEGLRLTAAGELLLEEARKLLASVSATEDRVQRLARGAAGRLVIGYNETVSWNTVIPKAIHRFRQENPAVELTLLPMLSVDQIEALHDRRIDAGFMFWWGTALPGLSNRKVLSTHIHIAVPESSRWVDHPPAHFGELAGEPFIFFPRRLAPAYHDAILARCTAAGFQPNVVQEVYNQSAALSLVAVGMGIAVIPETARHRCPASVRLISVPDLDLTATLDLVWRTESTDQPLIAKLIQTAAESAE